MLFCANFYSGVIQCFAAIVNHLISFVYLLTTLVIGSSLLWEMTLWLSVSAVASLALGIRGNGHASRTACHGSLLDSEKIMYRFT